MSSEVTILTSAPKTPELLLRYDTILRFILIAFYCVIFCYIIICATTLYGIMLYVCFCKLGGPCWGCPYIKSPTIWGSLIGPLIFGNSHVPHTIYHVPNTKHHILSTIYHRSSTIYSIRALIFCICLLHPTERHHELRGRRRPAGAVRVELGTAPRNLGRRRL